MSFSKGGKSSTTNNTSNEETTITETDNRVGGDNAVFGGNVSLNPNDSPIGSINVTTTDQGAVRGGVDIALESLDFARSTQEGIKSVAKDSISQGFDLAQAARQSETSGAINNFLKFGAIIAVAGLAAWAFIRRK